MGGRIDEGMPRMANERLPERSIFIAMTRPAGLTGAAYFRTNRSCRLAPAHQGMKIGTTHNPSGFQRKLE